MPEDFIKRLRAHLGLVWVDDSTARVIEDQALEGLAYLRRYDPDFDLTDPFRSGLLITLVRYIRAGATSDFAENYRKELLALSDHGLQEE